MRHPRKTSHTPYDCQYSIVWITQYGKTLLADLVAEGVGALIRRIGKEEEVVILKGRVPKDSFHYIGVRSCPFGHKQMSTVKVQ